LNLRTFRWCFPIFEAVICGAPTSTVTCGIPSDKVAGIPDTFVFHDLRHTQASLMLASGVDLKVIQARLGHRDFATTANTYSHLLQNAQNEAVEKMAAMMKRTTKKHNE
jgi:hypothetical protein